MRAVPLAIAAGLLAGCVTYQPGSFAASGQPFAGHRATVGCLDLALAASREPVARGPIVGFQFGNRCDRAVPVDLGAVRVTGRTPAGEEVEMVPFDPYRELRAVSLDVRRTGRERIEYRVARDFSGDVVQVCVDVRAIEPRAGDAPVICLGNVQVAEVTP